MIGAPGRSRTLNLLIRSQTLYPVELQALFYNLMHMSNKTIIFFASKEDNKQRIDICLSKKLKNQSRSNLKKDIIEKRVKINGIIISSPSKKIKENDRIEIKINEGEKSKLKGEKISLNIIYEDNELLIINKPSGMVVHPGAGNKSKTLVNGLIFKYKNLSNISGMQRPGIVHRIDKNTSGLLVVAKNNYAHTQLSNQFSKHTINRKYIALIWGVLRPLRGKIETLITRDLRNRQLMTVSFSKGKKAITHYETQRVFFAKDLPKISLVEFKLLTGRTHQIRVHMNYKKTPILGDSKYKKKVTKFKKINLDFKKFSIN